MTRLVLLATWLRSADSSSSERQCFQIILPPQKPRPQIVPYIRKTSNFIYSGNIFPLILPPPHPFTRRLVFNVFQRTSANYHWTSWDFHLAQLITLSSQVHYHIPPLKKMCPTLCDCLCTCVYRCRCSVCVLVYAWLCFKHIANCKWFSHNTRVNEPEPSIGAGSGSQVGNLLVCISGEGSESVLILMNNSPVTVLVCITPCRG